MDGKGLTSVSKGCFVVRGKKTGKRKLDTSVYFSTSSQLPDKRRWTMAENGWEEMENKIKILHSGLTSDIFAELLNFIKKSSQPLHEREKSGKQAEIPSAAVITGVNMPDHTGLFNQLCNEIKASVTPHVAVLCAKNCSNMKIFMRCIGQQLILGEAEDLHNASVEEPEIISNPSSVEKGANFIWKRSTPLTMPLLEKWYSVVDHTINAKTPKKQKKEARNNPPIVVVLRDTEAFVPNLLQDLIAMFSTMLNSLPVIFIFGVATSWANVVDRQLPHSATVHLGLEKFHSPSASQHLTLVINEILLTSAHPFKLGGKCMRLLLDVFLCHDFSVTNFLSMLKFCVLEHFYEEPASIFCTNDIEKIEKFVNGATKDLLNHLRNLPSMETYLSAMTNKQKELLVKSDDEFKKIILTMIKDLHNFHKHFYPVMQSLFALCKSLPRHPLGRHLRELYCACDHSSITASEEYKQARLLIQVSSRDQLTQRLNSCMQELEKLPATKEGNSLPGNSFAHTAKETVKSLTSIIVDLCRLDDLQEKAEEYDGEESSDEEEDKPLEKVKYAYQLKEKLQNRSKKKKMKKMSAYEKLRIKAIESLDELFKKILLPPRSLPLHEIYYFDSTSTVKRHMVAAPRLAIQTALSDPRYYLQHPCLDATDGFIPPSAPDVSIAYKLHNECGRIINLYDWLEAFHTIVTSENGQEEDNQEVREINEVTQARFIRAASELQFLGFIKPTKKKTDHIQRLTWSHS